MTRKHRYPHQHRPPLRDPSRIQYPNAEWTEVAGYEAQAAPAAPGRAFRLRTQAKSAAPPMPPVWPNDKAAPASLRPGWGRSGSLIGSLTPERDDTMARDTVPA